MTTTTMPREGAAAPGPASAGPIVTVDHHAVFFGVVAIRLFRWE